MNTRNITAMLAAIISIAGCGGGGGGAPAAQVPVTPVTPAPTVTLTLSQSKVSLGNSSTVTWSSTNATSCSASGAWSGAQAISGTSRQTPTVSGAGAYTLTCTGAGGSASLTATLTVPIPVLPSSYENKIAAINVIGPQAIPTIGNLPDWQTIAYAFGDFFQDGTYSLVTSPQVSDATKPPAVGKHISTFIFWKKNSSGVWEDHTSEILKDNTGCIQAGKMVVADFNSDGIPDIFVSCPGFDQDPYAGENQRILLSNKDIGKYSNIVIPVIGNISASAADVDHDGNIDIIVTDMRGNNSRDPIYFLKGHGDGSFSVDYSYIERPETIWQANGPFFAVELIDFNQNGNYDIIVGGIESPTHHSLIVPYDPVTKNFLTSKVINLPSDLTVNWPESFIYDKTTKAIYIATHSDWCSDSSVCLTTSIQKIDYLTLASSNILSHKGYYSAKEGLSYIENIAFFNGNVVAVNSGYGVSVKK